MAGRARAGRAGRTATVTPDTGISGDFKDTDYKESGGGYDGPDPASGLYKVKLTSVGAHTTSDTAIVWTFDIIEGKYTGWRGWSYSDMDNAKWKTQQLLVGLGVIEPNAEINKTYEQIMKEAQPCRARVVSELYNDEHRAKIRTLLPGLGAATAEADEEEKDEDFDDAPAPSRRSRAKAADPEPEDDEEEGDADEERQDREEELDSLDLPALKKAAKAAGLTLADYRGKDAKALVTLILDKEFPSDEEGEEGEGEEGLDLEALEEQLEDMDLKQLKAKAKEFGAKVADIKGLDEEELIDWIMEKAEEQNPSF